MALDNCAFDSGDVAGNGVTFLTFLENRPNEIFAVLEALIVKLTNDGCGKNAIKHDKQGQCDKHGPAGRLEEE